MKKKSVEIPESLYMGLVCARAALPTYPTVDSLVEQAVNDFLRSLINSQRTTAHCLENYVQVYYEEKKEE